MGALTIGWLRKNNHSAIVDRIRQLSYVPELKDEAELCSLFTFIATEEGYDFWHTLWLTGADTNCKIFYEKYPLRKDLKLLNKYKLFYKTNFTPVSFSPEQREKMIKDGFEDLLSN